MYKSRFFPLEKTVLFRKIQVLTPKTRFSRGKEYFTSAIVFYSGKFSFFREKLLNPIFSIRKNSFVKKILVLTSKTRFSRGKVYFSSENSILQWKPQFFQRKT